MDKLPIFGILLFALCSTVLAPMAIANNEAGAQPAMIGLQLQEIPEGLRSQLGDRIPADQGILIADVRHDGPAGRAGIHRHDIILSYSDQKLFSVHQMVALVHSDQPGQKVQLQLLRAGEPLKVEVTLGKNQIAQNQAYGLPYSHPRGMPRAPFGYKGFNMPETPMVWDEFESIQVQTLADGRYRAEVKYKGNNDETKTFTFEGNRKEIIDQINKQKDIAADKKQALLSALNMNPVSNLYDRMYNDPYFQRNFYNDSFFRGFPDMRMPYWQFR